MSGVSRTWRLSTGGVACEICHEFAGMGHARLSQPSYLTHTHHFTFLPQRCVKAYRW